MCGIIAGLSNDPGENIAPMLLGGLAREEYRGYDSAGVAVLNGHGIAVRKDVGRVFELEKKYRVSEMRGRLGIAHTRWATHGGVEQRNAHPLVSCGGLVAIVHNGILKNHLELRGELAANGHRFKSETDSEVIAHLIEEKYIDRRDPLKATVSASSTLRGQYAFVAMFGDRGDVLTAARNDAPLVAGVAEGTTFLASDVLAFLPHTDRAIYFDNREVVELSEGGTIREFTLRGKEMSRKGEAQLTWELGELSKRSFAHYTLKEIHEQQSTLRAAMSQDRETLETVSEMMKSARSIVITAAGSSYHAGLLLKARLAAGAKMRSDAILAGEFGRDVSSFIDRGTLLIALSQSGETADVLSAVKQASRRGARVVSIVNAAGSTLARESSVVVPLRCGPEIGVAATKSFTAQVMIGNLIVDSIASTQTIGSPDRMGKLVEKVLETEGAMRGLAKKYRGRSDFYFIARGHGYPVAQEGALKLKELSYVHAEGMPASELKHGTLALIEPGTPVVVVCPSWGEGYEATLANANELHARGAEIIGLSQRDHPIFTHTIKIPLSNESLAPILEVIPLQLLAYFMATERNNDPDYPRNLAKSVTVR